MSSSTSANTGPRFVVGIDLGTTNSAVAYVDSLEREAKVKVFPVVQFVAPGEIEAREILPSFHYTPAQGEFAAMRLPWETDDSKHIVGILARDHGASVPGRLVVSAKSWLSHSGVDRTTSLLPWHGAPDVEKLSPTEVSARYLGHIRAAWNHRWPEHPLEKQDVVITIPASFDEIARELTVAAAQRAGLPRIVLIEEPQAAFYAWINSQGDRWSEQLKPGQKILVCDVGGGTTDFTLIEVRPGERGEVNFHRFAVGEHLILGGDNLDMALAHFIEQRLTNGGKLESRQWSVLVRRCQQAKETLLGSNAPERLAINLPSGGSRLISGAQITEVTREEVRELLIDGFMPRVKIEEQPAKRSSGFQEFGLPYAPDHAITRYLAAFLKAHPTPALDDSPPHCFEDSAVPPHPHGEGTAVAALSSSDDQSAVANAGPNSPPRERAGMRGREDSATTPKQQPVPPGITRNDSVRPDVLLFNGGLFESAEMRDRLVEVLRSWFADENARTLWSPLVLKNDRLDLAVAIGAAYYGLVRRGLGVRISGGLPRSYYIGVTRHEKPAALCLVPAGLEEGQEVQLEGRQFDLLIRQPVEFPIFVSSSRTTDKSGDLMKFDQTQLSALPPIRTVLHAGKKNAPSETISVRLHVRLTEIGTLEVWCGEVNGRRRWKLQFDVRAATQTDAAVHAGTAERAGFIDEEAAQRCSELIRQAFLPGKEPIPPESLAKRMEQELAMQRLDWPPSLLRQIWEELMSVEEGRTRSVSHEARWLNLLGFALRPGFGFAVDDWRVAQTWQLFAKKVHHSGNELCRAEWWILWRRIAGGLVVGQQRVLAEPLVSALRARERTDKATEPGGRPKAPANAIFKFGPHETQEAWRLLGSLELLNPDLKSALGEMLVAHTIAKGPGALGGAALWSLGRIGTRVPMHGPLNAVVPVEVVERWVERLIGMNPANEAAVFPVVQMTRLTGDRYRDISESLRKQVLAWLGARAALEHHVELVRTGGELRREEENLAFGESLPQGLRLR